MGFDFRSELFQELSFDLYTNCQLGRHLCSHKMLVVIGVEVCDDGMNHKIKLSLSELFINLNIHVFLESSNNCYL